MAKFISSTLDPDNPPRLSEAEKAHYDSLTDAQADAMAEADPDNPPLTPEQLATAFRLADVRLLRERLALSQAKFADRYGISLRSLQDWEQGRARPDQVARTYLKLILRDPALIAREVAAERAEALRDVMAATVPA